MPNLLPNSLPIEVWTTLVGVIMGFALASAKDWISARKLRKEKCDSIKALLTLEVNHNLDFLREIHDTVQSELTRYHDTFVRTESGGFHTEGHPLVVLIDHNRFDQLTVRVWSTQLQHIPDVYDAAAMAQLFVFYSALAEIQAVQKRLLGTDHRAQWRLMEMVLAKIESILNTYSALPTLLQDGG